jgi:hypothetical protein
MAASLVQDLWLGFEPRLRGRRLAPWDEPATRLLLQLDAGQRLEDPAVAALLEALAQRLEVLAWEPRCAASGVPGPESLDDARRLATNGGRRFGSRAVLLGGLGLGGWIALALAGTPGLAGAVALAPALAGAGRTAPEPSPLRVELADALAAAPPDLPLLVAEGSERPPAEARAVGEWLARARGAAHLVVPGGDETLLAPPWPAVVSGWADALGRPPR